ncbi:MAG: YCF48-related protein [Candidatus Lernaella stagnicola]|nr:YCF48-related protein [Candidatus Lernaella stagnicola]
MKFRLGLCLVVAGVSLAILGGATGVVFALTNGDCPTLAYRDRLFDATFATEDQGWVVGYPGIVLTTPDGGKSWKRACDLSEQALFAVDFLDADHGWIVGRAGKVISTADGGGNWFKHDAVCEEPLFDVDFVDSQHGWAVGNFGRVIRTVDGGKTWIKEILEPMANASINALYMHDAQNGFLVGEYPAWEAALDEDVSADTLSNMFRTHDGGATWEIVQVGTHFALYDIVFRDAQHGWAVGTKGTLVRTVDGGETWEKIATGTEVNLFKAAVAPDAVYAVGVAGVVLKIVGDKVEIIDLKAYSWLASAAFSPKGNGIIIGGRGTLFFKEEAGADWKRLPFSI